MKNILILTIVTLLLSGCGSNDSGSNDSESNDSVDGGEITNIPGINLDRGDTSMIMNQQYVVSEGDQIFKESDLTKVKITHTNGNTQSTVELIEGSATLRKN